MTRMLPLLLAALPSLAAAQAPAPSPAAAQAGSAARAALPGQAAAASRDPVMTTGGLAAGASVAWIYEERFRLVHACVFNPAEGGRIECWNKALTDSRPSR